MRQSDLISLVREKTGRLLDLSGELRTLLLECEAAGYLKDGFDARAFDGANAVVTGDELAAAMRALAELDAALMADGRLGILCRIRG